MYKKSLKLQLFQLLFSLCIILYLHYSHLHPHLTIKSLFHKLPMFFLFFIFIFEQNKPLLVLILLSPHLPAPPGLIFPLWLQLSIIFTTCFQFLRYLHLAAYTNPFTQPAVYLGVLRAAGVLTEEGQDICFQCSYVSLAGFEEEL